MNKLVFLLVLSIFCSTACTKKPASIPKPEWWGTHFYEEQNKQLGLPKSNEKRVVFIGNSITQNWVRLKPDFFKTNRYVGRGILGENSTLILKRFQQDVVALKPFAVVINAGINDIGEVIDGQKYDSELTFGNIEKMVELAQNNHIEVILSAVLPALDAPYGRIQKIDSLNLRISALAYANGFAYIDYNTPMRSQTNEMIEAYTDDGFHPNEKGYEVMEAVAKPIIDKVIK